MFILIVLSCFLCFSSFQNNSKIIWSSGKKLNWNQFNGIPNSSSSESAATKTRIEIDVISKKQTAEFNVSLNPVSHGLRQMIRPF